MGKHKLIKFFLLSFIGWFVAYVLLHRYGSPRGMGPYSWQEIYDDLYVYLLMGLGGAILLTFGYYSSKYGNKKEKGKTNDKKRN